MACGRCEAAVCGRCVVLSIVGNRCKSCAPETGHRAFRSASAETPLFGIFANPLAKMAIALVVVAGVATVLGYAWLQGDRDRLIVRSVVFGGALASMVLHEFSHGFVGYLGGDDTVKSRGFLTLNPLKYMDPVFSIAMPMLFVLLGGIPIMGGRTLIHRENLRGPWWGTAVSLAGPGSAGGAGSRRPPPPGRD